MFGIGLGEITLVLLIAFFFSPRDLPKVLRKIGVVLGTIERIRDEVFSLKKDVSNIVNDLEKEETTVSRDIKKEFNDIITIDNESDVLYTVVSSTVPEPSGKEERDV